MKKLSIVFIFVALFTVSLFAQGNSSASPANMSADSKKVEESPLVSNWEVTISAPGQDLLGTLKIEKDGDNYKGSVTTDLGEAPMKNIKIKDNTFTADITVNVQGQTMEGTISGKLAAEKLTGDITLPNFGAIPYTGKKPDKK